MKVLVSIYFRRWSLDNSVLATHKGLDVVMADTIEEAMQKYNKRPPFNPKTPHNGVFKVTFEEVEP